MSGAETREDVLSAGDVGGALRTAVMGSARRGYRRQCGSWGFNCVQRKRCVTSGGVENALEEMGRGVQR